MTRRDDISGDTQQKPDGKAHNIDGQTLFLFDNATRADI
jgi:hypothetical protein